MAAFIAVVVAPACAPETGHAPAELPGTRSLSLLFTADLHSHLEPESLPISSRDAAAGLGEAGSVAVVGGVARVAAVLRERERAGPTVYVDAGDLLEGTSFFPRFGGEPEMRVAAALGLSALTLGNHDLAQGADAVDAVRRTWATFPLLGANLGPELDAGWVTPFTMISRGGVRVLVVGLSRRDTGVPDLSASAAAVNAVVAEHRAEADLVVLSSHLGREMDVLIVPKTFGLDVLVGGHTHDVVLPPIVVSDCDEDTAARYGCESEGVPVVHPGAYGRFVGRADFVFDAPGSGRAVRPSVILDEQFSLTPITDAVPEQPDVVELLAPYRALLDREGDSRPVAYAPETLSRRAASRGDSALGDVVSDALRARAGADAAVVNTTGIRADVVAGPVTAGDVTRVLPFSDELVVVRTTVSGLRAALRGVISDACTAGDGSPVQISGFSLDVTCRPFALALSGLGADGTAIRVAAPSYLTDGRYLEPDASSDLEPPLTPVRDAWISVLRAAPPCASGTGDGLPCLVGAVDNRVRFR